ncbi:hypothetical protein [Acuticoccus sediminis]|uniref:hypothetical protein n=1 Tax=Acuticoccus sediminis TaxID=2184697 RepID=UPI001CFE0459|nr:hypothetical protein [Acuticoccus sediminis]
MLKHVMSAAAVVCLLSGAALAQESSDRIKVEKTQTKHDEGVLKETGNAVGTAFEKTGDAVGNATEKAMGTVGNVARSGEQLDREAKPR